MNKRMLFLGFAVALFFSTAIVLAQEQVPAPTFKEGDTWQINISRQGQIGSSTDQTEGLYEIVYTKGTARAFKIEGGQKTEVDGVLGIIGKNEQRPDLKFPLSVGQKWNYEITVRPPGARRDQRRSVEVAVVGQEQVTTPAGSFKTYKLVRSESWSAGLAGSPTSSTSTFFYSPEMRSIVKRVTENSNNPGITTVELIKFTPGN
jgi:hypothetical protein